jgi:acetyl esterase/lipase
MIRLIVIILLFLMSLLILFKAPTYHLWLLAIIVSEFPWVFVIIITLLLSAGFWWHKYQLASNIIGIVALMIFLSPVIRAYAIASTLKQNFNEAFAITDTTKQDVGRPFTALQMFAGLGRGEVAYQTLQYSRSNGVKLDLDFYAAQAASKRPCVIVVHGGSWSSGDNKQLPELNSYLAKKGYHVASVNYRMAPRYNNPAPIEDVMQAIKYLKINADKLRIDTNNFVLLGRSAGAQIALLTAYKSNIAGLKGVIDFYGPADMVWGYSKPASKLVMDSRAVMHNYLGGTYKAVPDKYKASSPIEYVNRHTVPTLIIHGDNDVLVAEEHSRRLAKKLKMNGIKHYYLKLPWATHGFDFTINGPGGQLSTYTIENFLTIITGS